MNHGLNLVKRPRVQMRDFTWIAPAQPHALLLGDDEQGV
jgi:hypothetical protein